MNSPDPVQEAPQESFKVQFWGIREYKGARGITYTIRWVVGGKGGTTHPETFKHKGLAESRLAQVRTLAKQGEPFDLVTGLPMCEVRAGQAKAAKEEAEAQKASGPTWYEHSLNYISRRGPGLSGNSMRSVAETLANVTLVLFRPGDGRPADDVLRDALYGWAFRSNAGDPPEDIAAVLAWVAAHSRPLADLSLNPPTDMAFGCWCRFVLLPAIRAWLSGRSLFLRLVRGPWSGLGWWAVTAVLVR
jgi:hypothetical protein